MGVVADQPYTLRDHDLLMDVAEGEYVLRVQDLNEADRPREKLLAAGPEGLNLAELCAVIWNVGTRREDVLSMARRTLQEYGEKAIANGLKPQQLAAATDIPIVKACQLVAALE